MNHANTMPLSSWASGSPFFAVGLAILIIGALVAIVVLARGGDHLDGDDE